ncbi:MAG: alpha/beta hydrolase fold [Rhizorhabdus sp.]|nr:alpha/beta hydrolase fold [Rhizorhabdus sp.]
MTSRDRDGGILLECPGNHAALLLHGLTGAPVEMHPLAKRLHRAGCVVHAPMIAGHGAGNDRLLATRWQDWLGSAERAYDDLAHQYEHVHVGGICLGAMLAVALAARRTVTSIAAFGTTFRYDGWSMPRIAANRRLIALLAGLPGVRSIGIPESEPFGLKDERIRAFVVGAQHRANGGSVDSFPLGAVRQLYRLADHVERVAPKVMAPTLILHAREDDVSSLANAYRLRARLGGEAHIRILEDSYHLIHLDREMEQVAAVTAAFFGLPHAARLLAARTPCDSVRSVA